MHVESYSFIANLQLNSDVLLITNYPENFYPSRQANCLPYNMSHPQKCDTLASIQELNAALQNLTVESPRLGILSLSGGKYTLTVIIKCITNKDRTSEQNIFIPRQRTYKPRPSRQLRDHIILLDPKVPAHARTPDRAVLREQR